MSPIGRARDNHILFTTCGLAESGYERGYTPFPLVFHHIPFKAGVVGSRPTRPRISLSNRADCEGNKHRLTADCRRRASEKEAIVAKSAHPFTPPRSLTASPEPSIHVSRFPTLVKSFLLAGDIDQHSERTIDTRRERLSRFFWFIEREGIQEIDTDAVRQFLHYLRNGHKEEDGTAGRFGNPRINQPAASGTVKSYHSTLRTFFNWCVREGVAAGAPTDRIPTPLDRPDQIQPFTPEQVARLHEAAKRKRTPKGERRANPKRDESIFLTLLDTGMRASELCALTVGDVDFDSRHVRVRYGKGGKERTLHFSSDTKRVLLSYVNERQTRADDPLFESERGMKAGDALTRFGLRQMVVRWAKIAGIDGSVRCSPHTFRHTFAIEFLRDKGEVFALKQMLGHESLTMVNRYIALSQADTDRQHALHSPVTRFLRMKKRGAI